MRIADKVKILIEESDVETDVRVDARILGDAFSHFEELKRRKLAESQPSVWRLIMKSRMTKYAAAAVIIAATLVAVNQLGGDGAGAVFAKAVEQLHNARTMTYSMVTFTNIETMPAVRMEMAFKEPGYIRTTTTDGFVTVVDWVQGKGLSIMPPRRQFVEMEVSNFPHDPAQDPFAVIEKLRALPSRADEVLAEKEFDGRVIQGFRVAKDGMITTVWVDPQTKELARVEVEFTSAPGMNMVMSNFQFDAELDDSLFSLTPPEGFTRVGVQADVSQVTELDLIEYLRAWSSWMKDGTFPPTLVGTQLPKIAMEMAKQGKFIANEGGEQQRDKDATLMYRGMMFVAQLPAESNWRYAGEKVKYGEAETPVFWYQPKGSETYRIIYGDLSVRDAAPESLPK
jgi:outer membrane lipoprotein-sorting protein